MININKCIDIKILKYNKIIIGGTNEIRLIFSLFIFVLLCQFL